jgi:glycosyltransferase involved in cell wall biosynthesis
MQNLKHVLLITYYWPPAGGPGVHRWLRFSKYFHENGYQLHVYCPKDAAWPIIDKNLSKQVDSHIIEVRNKIFEPHKYLGKKNNPNVGGGITQQKKSSFLQKIIIWTRGNLFIPDARVFWIRPSVGFLSQYLHQHPEIKTIISTGPPHSLHIIALKLKKRFPIKWVADFRDPWTEIDFYDDLMTGKWADTKQKRLEKSCLQTADEVVTVSKACAEGLERIGKRKVHVITNGYPFPETKANVSLDNEFSIVHVGSMPNARNPLNLWKALGEWRMESEEFKNLLKIKLIGAVDYSVFESLEKNGLSDCVEHTPMVDHQESLLLQQKAQLLLLVANNSGNVKGILTGKVFEYLATSRPIIAFGEKDSNLEALIMETNSGTFFDFNELENIKSVLLSYFEMFKKGELISHSTNLEKYDSKEIVKKMLKLL